MLRYALMALALFPLPAQQDSQTAAEVKVFFHTPDLDRLDPCSSLSQFTSAWKRPHPKVNKGQPGGISVQGCTAFNVPFGPYLVKGDGTTYSGYHGTCNVSQRRTACVISADDQRADLAPKRFRFQLSGFETGGASVWLTVSSLFSGRRQDVLVGQDLVGEVSMLLNDAVVSVVIDGKSVGSFAVDGRKGRDFVVRQCASPGLIEAIPVR